MLFKQKEKAINNLEEELKKCINENDMKHAQSIKKFNKTLCQYKIDIGKIQDDYKDLFDEKENLINNIKKLENSINEKEIK